MGRNRHIVSLLKLAEQSSDTRLVQQLNAMLMKEDGEFNQKVRGEQITLCMGCAAYYQ